MVKKHIVDFKKSKRHSFFSEDVVFSLEVVFDSTGWKSAIFGHLSCDAEYILSSISIDMFDPMRAH